MKNNLLLAMFLSYSMVSFGQITLKKTLEGDVNYTDAYALSSYGDVDYYCKSISNDTRIEIYNSDLSLYKSVQLGLSDSPAFVSCLYFTRTLFNKDAKIEFLVITNQHLYLCNEDGKVLQDFGANASTATVHKLPNGEYRMTVLRVAFVDGIADYTTDIYSLPGSFSSRVEQEGQRSEWGVPYPNPASTVINLPYTLQQGETATMQIFNPQGQLQEEKQLGSMFDEIMLDVSSYAKGAYVYTVNGVSNRFIVK